jgi:hypothetical protein
MFNLKNSEKKPGDFLLPNESLLGFYFQSKVQLTTHRIRYKQSLYGENFLSSIFLDSISMIQVKSKKQYLILILGLIFFSSSFFLTSEEFELVKYILLIVGIGLIILFFFSDVTQIIIFSKGMGKIILVPLAISKNQYMEFLNSTELAINNYKNENYLKSKDQTDNKSGYKKEDFY